jgi:hypothetical protein
MSSGQGFKIEILKYPNYNGKGDRYYYIDSSNNVRKYSNDLNKMKKLMDKDLENNKDHKIIKIDYSNYASGGKVTFADKVKSIKSSLLKRKKVSPKVQKDYGKTYSPAEAEDSAKRIVGSITAKERLINRMKKAKK